MCNAAVRENAVALLRTLVQTALIRYTMDSRSGICAISRISNIQSSESNERGSLTIDAVHSQLDSTRLPTAHCPSRDAKFMSTSLVSSPPLCYLSSTVLMSPSPRLTHPSTLHTCLLLFVLLSTQHHNSAVASACSKQFTLANTVQHG